MIKRLAIIPARGGSKRIKGKNLKRINNKQLLSYSLEAAIKSNIFSKIHVSSDNQKILKLAESFNIKTDFVRTKNLSNDSCPLWDVIEYVVKTYLKNDLKFDEVWLIYATNPFISSKTILECKKIFNKGSGKKPLMTVAKYNQPPEWALIVYKNGLLKPLFHDKLKIRSQDLTTKYCDAGMLTVYPSNFFYKKKPHMYKYTPYILSANKSVDIDDMDDFSLAKKLLTVKNVN